MPDSSSVCSDEEIIFSKRNVPKFVDSDEEIVFHKRTVPKFVDSDEDCKRTIPNDDVPKREQKKFFDERNSDGEGTVGSKASSPVLGKPKRRIIRRNDSDSDEEDSVFDKSKSTGGPDATRQSQIDLDSESLRPASTDSVSKKYKSKRRQKESEEVKNNDGDSEGEPSTGSVFEKLKSRRKQKELRAEGVEKNEPNSAETVPASKESKPMFADKDLYDAECSEDEEDRGTVHHEEKQSKRSKHHQDKNKKSPSLFADRELYDNEGSGEDSRGATSVKERAKSRKEKKAGKKGSFTETDKIHSETQRMVRESRLSLPYHRPRQRTLEEFLQRRPSTSVVPTKSVRMTVDQLTAMERRLKERAKQAEEFYKSSSDEEEPAVDQATSQAAEKNKENLLKLENTEKSVNDAKEESAQGQVSSEAAQKCADATGENSTNLAMTGNTDMSVDFRRRENLLGQILVEDAENRNLASPAITENTEMSFVAERSENPANVEATENVEAKVGKEIEVPGTSFEVVRNESMCVDTASIEPDTSESVTRPSFSFGDSLFSKGKTDMTLDRTSLNMADCSNQNAVFTKPSLSSGDSSFSRGETGMTVELANLNLASCSSQNAVFTKPSISFGDSSFNKGETGVTLGLANVASCPSQSTVFTRPSISSGDSSFSKGETGITVGLANLNVASCSSQNIPFTLSEETCGLDNSSFGPAAKPNKKTGDGNFSCFKKPDNMGISQSDVMSIMDESMQSHDYSKTNSEPRCKKNLSELLFKEIGASEEVCEAKTEQPKLFLQGEDAKSVPVNASQKNLKRSGRSDVELPSLILEGDDATLKTMSESFDSLTPSQNTSFSRHDTSRLLETSSSDFKTPEVRRRSQGSFLKDNDTSSSSLFGKLLCGEGVNENSIPRLIGSPSEVIDLDSTPEPCGVLALMNRFIKHSTLKKPKAEPRVVDVGIVTAEQGDGEVPEVKKESVSVLLSGDESTSSNLPPGAKLKLLKQQLAQQMAQQREQEWLRRQQESQEMEEKTLDEKSDCGAFEDEEELMEEDMTSSESEEEEEEEEERVRTKEKRVKSAFVDDEAEVSEDDDGDDERESSEDEEEEEDVTEEQKEDKEAPSLTKESSGLKRTQTFDLFASQEYLDADDESVAEDADIPPYQLGGALTPTLVEPLKPPITRLKPVLSSPKEMFSSPLPDVLRLCSEPNMPGGGNATEKEIEDELLGLCSGKFLTQPVEPSQDAEASQPLPDTQPVPSVLREEGRLDGRSTQKMFLSSDEEDDDLAATKTKKKSNKRLTFSDDENEDGNDEEEEEPEKDDDEEEDDDEDIEEGDKEEEAKLVDYDSEENEVVLPRMAKDFFEDEAELSESEWGSADEDEKDLDTLDWEEGDEEKLDQKQLKEQLGKIHMRQMLDDDQQEVRRLQELLLEDGELHSEGGGRQRQFRWKNLSLLDDLTENRRPSDDEGVGYGDDEEDEQEWRRMRFARETFLQEQRAKAGGAETITEVEFAEKLKLRLCQAQVQLQTLSRQTKRGSFLARSEAALARISQLVGNGNSEGKVLAPSNSRNFLFATLSPEKKGQEKPMVKRRQSVPNLPAVKKPRLSEGLLDRLGF